MFAGAFGFGCQVGGGGVGLGCLGVLVLVGLALLSRTSMDSRVGSRFQMGRQARRVLVGGLDEGHWIRCW